MDFDETSVAYQFGVGECNGLYIIFVPKFLGGLGWGKLTPHPKFAKFVGVTALFQTALARKVLVVAEI